MTITKRVSKKGDISYRIKVSLGYSVDGKQIIQSMTYKPDPKLTLRQAEKEANRQGVLFEEKCKANAVIGRKVKFQDVANEFLEFAERTQKIKLSSLVRLKGLRTRTYEAIGHIYVDKLTRKQIQDFIISLSENGTNQKTGGGLSQKTQKHYITFISDVMQYAFDNGMIDETPCKHILTVKTEKQEQAVYSLEETKAILDLINVKADIDYKVFFNVLPYCGMRRAEVLGLEYGDIDFNTGEVMVVRTSNYQNADTGIYTSTPKTKTGYRELIFPPNVLEMIKQLKRSQQLQASKLGDLWHESDRLFVAWNGLPMHPNTPYTWLHRFCETEGLPFKGLKAFRHFFATQAITSGVDVKTVSSMLGHAQTSTTLNIYAHAVKKANVNGFGTIAKLISE